MRYKMGYNIEYNVGYSMGHNMGCNMGCNMGYCILYWNLFRYVVLFNDYRWDAWVVQPPLVCEGN